MHRGIRCWLLALLILNAAFLLIGTIAEASELATPLSVAPEGRYFQDASGAPFIIVGEVNLINFGPFLNRALHQGDIAAAETYLAILAKHGVNTMRLVIESAWNTNSLLENPLGVYDPRVLRFWDELIPLFKKYGVGIIMTFYTTGGMEANWDTNPYNIKNGGPVVSTREGGGFISEPAALEHQKRRFQFVLDRWGGPGSSIIAWDLMNEINFRGSAEEIEAWVTVMAQFMRELDRKTWGVERPITTSAVQRLSTPSGLLAEVIYNHPDLDFSTIHQYIGTGQRAPRNTVETALEARYGTSFALGQIRDRRPLLDTESGPIDKQRTLDEAFDAEYYHNTAWGQFTSGMAGTGLRWPYRRPESLSDQMRRIQLGMSRFISDFDWRGFSPVPVFADMKVEHSSSTVHPFGMADDDRAILWLLSDDPSKTATNVGVSVANRPNGIYRLVFWSTYDGVVVAEKRVAVTDGQLSFTVTSVDRSLAVAVYRLGESAPSASASVEGTAVVDTTGRPLVNLAHGRPVMASSVVSADFSAEQAVDDNQDTKWTPASGDEPQWLQVDLGGEYELVRTEVRFQPSLNWYGRWDANAGGTTDTVVREDYDYLVEYSLDGSTWRVFADQTDSDKLSYPYFDYHDAVARYVRVTLTGLRPATADPSIYEFKVIGFSPMRVVSPKAGATVRENAPVHVTASDIALRDVQVRLDGETIYQGPDLPQDLVLRPAALEQGSHRLEVAAVDLMGAVHRHASDFVVEHLRVQPTRPVDGPLQGDLPIKIEVGACPESMANAEIELIMISDMEGPAQTELFAGSYLPADWTLSTRDFADGTYDLVVRVTTRAGITSEIRQRLVIDNWRVIDDQIEPPKDHGWFGIVPQMLTVTQSDGWEHATGDGATFWDDTSRLRRIAETDEYLVWECPDLVNFSFTLFAQAKDVQKTVVIEVSSDGETWSTRPYEVRVANCSGAGWAQLELSGEVSELQGASYIRLTFRAGESAHADLQLGRAVLRGVKR